MSIQSPVPMGSTIAAGRLPDGRKVGWMPTPDWVDYFLANDIRMGQSSQRLVSVGFTNQSASIAATPFALGTVSAAAYRITYVIQVEQAATTSSSLAVTVGYTSNGAARLETSVALTANAVVTPQSGVFMVTPDTPLITYATTYASVGGTPMTYRITFHVEALT